VGRFACGTYVENFAYAWLRAFFCSQAESTPAQIRDKLKELNVTIEDSKDGTTWRYS
jgi:hypothetical protein